MSAWFVERVEDHFWWTGQRLSGHSFGFDPNKALRFARKEDADTAIVLLLSVPDNDNTGLHCSYVATEHVWFGASPPHAVALLPCPFCGSRNIDPEEWSSLERSGPGCDDCGACAETIELWNRRASPSAQPIARDEQDAKRYRWLMDVWDEACPFANGLPLWDYDSSMVNAAIDHERLAEKDKGG